MRAPISCQSEMCLRKMADLQGQLNSSQDFFVVKAKKKMFWTIKKIQNGGWRENLIKEGFDEGKI